MFKRKWQQQREQEKNIIIKFTQLASLFVGRPERERVGKITQRNYRRDLNIIKLLTFILLFLLLRCAAALYGNGL